MSKPVIVMVSVVFLVTNISKKILSRMPAPHAIRLSPPLILCFCVNLSPFPLYFFYLVIPEHVSNYNTVRQSHLNKTGQ